MKVINQNPTSDFKYIIGRCPKCDEIVSTYNDAIKCHYCNEKLEWKKWKNFELVDDH